MRVEEVDLKLPPKPMSEAIAEKMEQTKKAKKEKQDFEFRAAHAVSKSDAEQHFTAQPLT